MAGAKLGAMDPSAARDSRFGKFEVLGRIGVGGMGEVFRARLPGPKPTDVALKLIRPENARDPRFLQMFATEARIGTLLDHPNIVRLLEVGDVDGVAYLAMELVEGPSLDRLIASRPLSSGVAS